jgi:hypothetical protein
VASEELFLRRNILLLFGLSKLDLDKIEVNRRVKGSLEGLFHNKYVGVVSGTKFNVRSADELAVAFKKHFFSRISQTSFSEARRKFYVC